MSAEENALEKAMRVAADNPSPAYRSEFYRLLLEFKLFVLTTTDLGFPAGEMIIRVETPVQLRMWQRADKSWYMPVFTSLETLRLRPAASKNDEWFIGMEGRLLFKTTVGTTCVLNPYGPCTKLLVPAEIDDLLKQDADQSVQAKPS